MTREYVVTTLFKFFQLVPHAYLTICRADQSTVWARGPLGISRSQHKIRTLYDDIAHLRLSSTLRIDRSHPLCFRLLCKSTSYAQFTHTSGTWFYN